MEINPDISALVRQGAGALKPDSERRVLPSAPETFPEQQPSALSPLASIAEALKLLGIKPTKEYVEIAVKLIDSGLPATKENIAKLNQGQRLTGSVDKAVFMLKSGVRINSANAGMLDAVCNREINSLSNLTDIAEAVEKLDNTDIKQEISDILSGGENFSEIPTEKTSLQTTETPRYEDLTETTETTPLTDDTNAENPPQAVRQTETPVTERETDAEIDGEPAPNPEASAKKSSLAQKNAETAERTKKDDSLTDMHSNAEKLSEKSALRERLLKERVSERRGISETETKKETRTDEGRARETNKYESDDNAAGENTGEKEEISPALKERVIARFAVRPETDKQEKLNERLNELREGLDRSRTVLERAAEPGNEGEAAGRKELAQKLESFIKAMDFQNEVKNGAYVQFPVIIGNREMNAELRVFSDGNHGSSGGKSARSALLAMDMAYIGRFEAYVRRDGKSVTCQFRASDNVLALAAEHISSLAAGLSRAGYRLDGYFFKELTEPFTLMDPEPGAEVGGKGLYNMDFRA